MMEESLGIGGVIGRSWSKFAVLKSNFRLVERCRSVQRVSRERKRDRGREGEEEEEEDQRRQESGERRCKQLLLCFSAFLLRCFFASLLFRLFALNYVQIESANL